jgi:hypothetical protein
MRDKWYTDHNGKLRLVRKRITKKYLCAVVYCKNPSLPRRTICGSCKSAEVRKNNPLWAEWHDKAYRHTRRGIKGKDRPCCTFEEWKEFHALRPSPDHVVDRIDPLGGYTLDNMQWITYEENASKGATFDKEAYAVAKRLGIRVIEPQWVTIDDDRNEFFD